MVGSEQLALPRRRLGGGVARAAVQLGAGLGGEAGARLDQLGGLLGRQGVVAQAGGRVTQASGELAEFVEGVGHRAEGFSRTSRSAAARMPLTNPGASAPQYVLAVSTASSMAASGGIGRSPATSSGSRSSSSATRRMLRSSGAMRSSVQPWEWRA